MTAHPNPCTPSPSNQDDLHPDARRSLLDTLRQEGVPEQLLRTLTFEIFEEEHHRGSVYASVLLRLTPGGNDGNVLLRWPAGQPELTQCTQLTFWVDGEVVQRSAGFQVTLSPAAEGVREGETLTLSGHPGTPLAGRTAHLKRTPGGLYLAGSARLQFFELGFGDLAAFRQVGEHLLRASLP